MFGIIEPFILLLVIMDPLVSMSALLSLVGNKDGKEIRSIALKAVFVAALVFFLFAFGGKLVLYVLGVDINSFKAAGGIVLSLLGIQMALGITFSREKKDLSSAAVVIGTPLITGPATIATTIILVEQVGLANTLIAGVLALLVVLVSLLLVQPISKLLGKNGMQVLSTMIGIVTIAWGVQFILSGASAFLGAA
ncbi:MAG: MarC family protein [Candidatus Micrarchaeota archaeon]|nr:MarC family protein [Candidatus Micrarchaeota archaeon]